MQLQIVLLLLCRFLLIEGRDDFEERKEFHEWLCRKRPSLSSCSKSFTKLSYEKELTDHGERGTPLLEKTAARAFAARTDVRRDSPWNDADEDEEYEYYLWKKYRRAKLRRRLLENSFDSTPSIHHHYHHSDQSYPYYSRPSYGYRYPSYSYGYPSYGYGRWIRLWISFIWRLWRLWRWLWWWTVQHGNNSRARHQHPHWWFWYWQQFRYWNRL
ncbi:hypothetical protein COOONC_04721, partial [Cooperia oncophora]